jgi:hypothetical protein
MMAPSSFAATLPPSSAADEATLPIQTPSSGQLAPSARSPGNAASLPGVLAARMVSMVAA